MNEEEAKLLVCSPDGVEGSMVRAYAGYLHKILGGHISFLPLADKADTAALGDENGNCALVVFGEPEQSPLEKLLWGSPCARFLSRSAASLLWARRPHWPITSILLILRFEETDEAAAEWVFSLAQLSGARVSILPIVPTPPAMFGLGYRVQNGLDLLLSPETAAGQALRGLARRMEAQQIKGELRLRHGEPDWQMRDEIAQGDYDLIVIGAEPHGRLHRMFLGELVGNMLYWLERPLLIARAPLPVSEVAFEQPVAL